VTAGDDHALARELADEAGRRLLELRARGGEPDLLRKAGDRLAHEFLVAALADRRPGDVVLSEEAADNPVRLSASRVWIVDPLDGTREFGEPGRTDWAVHVALWERSGASDSGDLTAGAVALPAQGRVLSTAPGERHGCHNDVAITTSLPQPRGQEAGEGHGQEAGEGHVQGAGERRGQEAGERRGQEAGERRGQEAGERRGQEGDRGEFRGVRIVVSRTRAPRFVRDISDLIGVVRPELVPLGSAGAKVAAVVCGEAEAYVHGGGFYEWDTAAPVAVARAAGFHASRIDGSPLVYNQANLRMPDILVCLPALAGTLLQAIREVTNAR
jgi:3'(2'), 5'-bisphosphate nucleotidase